ncbi:peptide ABC transporter substrate-binding protein [Bordetella sp. H567]|uniref:ABC transporter substrate-binding protein n=1 Tax=Bordetella sp. H567 TaxID=1697043 RepID=UPI00081D17C6|nr:ABC transporter substrate-binding protein [Bordetella sp. H567]AOB32806.1 peptide ABC transporter substrate-binding protein [Bordetella sp. H567]
MKIDIVSSHRKLGFALGSMALACTAAVGIACAADATPLRIAMTADIRSTEPGVNRDANSDMVVMHIVEGLVAFGEHAEIKPLLAKSYEVGDGGKTYTFTLRDGVTFQNGAPLTAQDVVWSWNYFMNPKTAWRCHGDFDGSAGPKVTSVETPDARTVVYRLDKPYGLFLASLARPDCAGGGVVHRDSLNPDGTWNKPIGTGPFMLQEWKRGQYISLAKNPRYANQDGKLDGFTGSKRPLVDEVRFMIVPDDATAKAALQRGDIDIIQDLSYTDVKPMQTVKGVKVTSSPVMSLTALLMQTRDPVLSNVKLRQAIVHAIDNAQLVAAVGDGLMQPSTSMVPLISPYYDTMQHETWKYDPALAQKLVRESGYKGQEIVMLATKRYPETYTSGVIIQAMLQAVGINTRLEVMEWATQMDHYSSGKYQMMTFPYSARLDPSLNYEMMAGNKDKQPRKVWDDPKALALIESSSALTDTAQRQAQFDELHKLFLADAPMMPLFNGLDVGAFRDTVRGYTPWALKRARAWEVSRNP